MKKFKKMFAVLAASALVAAMPLTAMAQTVEVSNTTATDNAKITISNAAKGVTYTIYKLFNATVAGTENNGSIAYTGKIPEALNAYFEQDSAGNISAKEEAYEGQNMSKGLKSALKTWAEKATPTETAKSDGSELEFTNLDYGYYVVTTSQGDMAISVDSTNPNAEIVDKNSTTPTIPESGGKTADQTNVNIGDTVTYTLKFKTSNYDGAGEKAKQIVSYTIHDTLPDWLDNVNVTSIKLDKDGDEKTTTDQEDLTTSQFDDQKQITIPWVNPEYTENAAEDEKYTSRYDNGIWVLVTYTATVGDNVAIDGDGNKNEFTLSWKKKDNTTSESETTAEETIYTYAIALKKVNDKGVNLAGATFEFPFYVKKEAASDGAYIYAGTEEKEGLTNQITTPDNGEITVKGVASGSYTIKEIAAPKGYNKLTKDITVTAVKTGATKTETTTYLDKNGEVSKEETTTKVIYKNDHFAATSQVVVNKTGIELPHTGGIGTTVFAVAGLVIMAGAAAVMVIKKRS